MKRRDFLLAPAAALAQAPERQQPLAEPHFPSRLHLFVWRNWELANLDRMAALLKTGEGNVRELGESMGLPLKRTLTADQLRRVYVTVIRQNWHVLSRSQLIELLGWTEERFTFTLKEDDFLDVKMGKPGKPVLPELFWEEPTQEQRERAREIKRTVWRYFGTSLSEHGEDLFDFVKVLSAPLSTPAVPAGWKIEAPDPALRAAAARAIARFGRTAPRSLVLANVEDEALTSESFRVRAAPAEIRIEAGTKEGLHEALRQLADIAAETGALPAEGELAKRCVWDPRYLYSYFALYGDPLIEPDLDPFPDSYLESLGRVGINGVWLQGVLNTLAPSEHFPEFGKGWETRLANLNKLVARAGALGMKVYLYVNEPRSMPAAFFEKRPGMRGASFEQVSSMCTSAPEVRDWLKQSLAHLFRHVPDLGGIFTISMSENHTNCFSHGGAWRKALPNAGDCPRCNKRGAVEALSELYQTFRDGVRESSANARVVFWDWGWTDDMSAMIIPKLPKDASYMSINEWSQPVRRGGIRTVVGEYSISVPGPGPRAARNWKIALDSGVSAFAKLQLNNTWEISAVPYIPVPHLVLENLENLRAAKVTGIQASWTCGGYASPNLEAAKAMFFEPTPPLHEILVSLARRRFGAKSAEWAVEAWRRFSEAFREFPYGVAIYIVPVQHGPANLLRWMPTKLAPGMILFPHDNWKAWAGMYPPEVAQEQFAKMSAMWKSGLEAMQEAFWLSSPESRANARFDLDVALTCYHHFQSVAHQFEFYRLRESKEKNAARMRQLAEAEIDLAVKQYHVARRNSVIGYEATNHYYYTPLDMVEKVVNCRWMIDREMTATP